MLTSYHIQLFTMRYIKNIETFIALGFIVMFGSSWGFLVHKTAHQLAMYELPPKMQRFFFKHLDYLELHAVRPDERRRFDKAEGPKHFIDVEAYDHSAQWKMPVTWDKAVAKYSKDSLLKNGYVPYQVMLLTNQLTHAFATHNADSILYYATDLGHYVEDANVPLHTTINHDGQLTNQKGLHALWESVIPETDIASFNLYSTHSAKYLQHPEQTIWMAIRQAHNLLPELFKVEKEVSKQFTIDNKFATRNKNHHPVKVYSTNFSRAYAARMQGMVNKQMLYAADMVADFWFTAWVNAGKPDLSSLLNIPFNKKDEAELNEQMQSYKSNQLLHEHLLLSKQKRSKKK